jgi:hypothetical protein
VGRERLAQQVWARLQASATLLASRSVKQTAAAARPAGDLLKNGGSNYRVRGAAAG